jgi:hypothetical protein
MLKLHSFTALKARRPNQGEFRALFSPRGGFGVVREAILPCLWLITPLPPSSPHFSSVCASLISCLSQRTLVVREANGKGINGRNGSGNVKGTDHRSNFVLDKGEEKPSLEANM